MKNDFLMTNQRHVFAQTAVFPTIDIEDENKKIFYKNRVVKLFLKKKCQGINISDFFTANNIKRIALYAATDFADWIIEDIKRNSNGLIKVVAIGDRRFKDITNQFLDYNVVSFEEIEELYNEKMIDCVVVCSVFYENEIISQFLRNNFKADDLVSIIDVICWSKQF